MARKARKEVRQGEMIRLLALLFLLPLLITVLFCAAFSVSLGQAVFPPVWLFLVMLIFPALFACVFFAAYRAVVFAFFRGIAFRIYHTLNIEVTKGESELSPFMLFHAGQEYEIIAESMEVWRGELAGEIAQLSSPNGLWNLSEQSRFPFAGAAPVYRYKSQELKKNKSHQNVRPAAVLAFFISFQDEERNTPRKRLELLSGLYANLFAIGEHYGGNAAEIAWGAFWLVFSSGGDEQIRATGALRAAKAIYDHARKAHPGAGIRVLADYFPLCEAMLLAGKVWRYHVESPDISALRIAAAAPVTSENGGLRFSSRIVSLVRSRGEAT